MKTFTSCSITIHDAPEINMTHFHYAGKKQCSINVSSSMEHNIMIMGTPEALTQLAYGILSELALPPKETPIPEEPTDAQ